MSWLLFPFIIPFSLPHFSASLISSSFSFLLLDSLSFFCSFPFVQNKDLDNSTRNMVLLAMISGTLGKKKIAHSIFHVGLNLIWTEAQYFSRNIYHSQLPYLRPGLWIRMLRPGFTQGPRRVSQWEIGRSPSSAGQSLLPAILVMGFTEQGSRGQPYNFQESPLN